MSKYICDKCKSEYKGNYCPICGDKRTTKDDEVMTDAEIIKDMIDDASVKVKSDVKKMDKMTLLGIALLFVSALLFFIGFYFKATTNGNVDTATNYVINASYFSGFMSLSSGFLVSGVLVLINTKKKVK